MSAVIHNIAREYNKARMWRFLTVLALILGIGHAYFSDYMHVQDERVTVINDGTAFSGTAQPLMKNETVYTDIAKLASNAIYSRTFESSDDKPGGYTYWECASYYFSKEMLDRLIQFANRDMDVFAKEKMTQTYTPVGRVTQLSASKDKMELSIDGEAICNYFLNGDFKNVETNTRQVRTYLTVEHNPDMAVNGKGPYIVTGLTIKFL